MSSEVKSCQAFPRVSTRDFACPRVGGWGCISHGRLYGKAMSQRDAFFNLVGYKGNEIKILVF